MTIDYTARNTTVTPEQKSFTAAALDRICRVTNRCTSAHIVLKEDKHRRIAEVTLSCRHDKFVAVCESTSMDSALHDAMKKIEQQAIRNKERWATVRDHGVGLGQQAA